MHRRTNTVFSGTVVLLLSAVVFFFASQIDRRIPIGVDSGFFPEIAAAFSSVLGLVILVQGLRTDQSLKMEGTGREGHRAVSLSLLLLLAFGAGMAIIGFLPAAVLYLFFQFLVLSPKKQRRIGMFALVAVASSTAIYLAFSLGFGLVLPSGYWG
ncbi:MAG: tripartite tricarboxylate transporter TctB family protein [Pseudomonadota bacterium]